MKHALKTLIFPLILAGSACSRHEVPPPAAVPQPESAQSSPRRTESSGAGKPDGDKQTVVASYYGGSDGFDGKKTASGERFNSNELTAASKSLPMGSEVKVTNPETQQSVNVRVNDRGPAPKGRGIDLSKKAAEEIGMKKKGKAKVEVERVK